MVQLELVYSFPSRICGKETLPHSERQVSGALPAALEAVVAQRESWHSVRRPKSVLPPSTASFEHLVLPVEWTVIPLIPILTSIWAPHLRSVLGARLLENTAANVMLPSPRRPVRMTHTRGFDDKCAGQFHQDWERRVGKTS